jgi:hypothetical protein
MRSNTGDHMKRAILAVAFLFVAACGDGIVGGPGAVADEWEDDDSAMLDDGVPAPDEGVGEPFADTDPSPGYDPCLDDDICPDEEPAEDPAEEPTEDPAGDPAENPPGDPPADPPAETEPTPPATNQYQPGDLLVVLKYAPLRNEPKNSSGVKPIHSNGGVHGGHPTGSVPPGELVVVQYQPRTNGYYKVEYRGYKGWIYGVKLASVDESVHPVKFARRSAVRDAFFMHQIRRTKWNKDGPSSSANCAPTSLAMAAKIFNLATHGRTIERNIHDARDSYNASSNESTGTTRAQIRAGAKKFGFTVKELGTNLPTATDEMYRLDKQLGYNRVVVLEGQPAGSQGADYRNRMTAAFRAAGVNDRSYTYQGRHSILVVSKLDNGKYVVADPISEAGMVTMSRQQLKSFIKSWGGTGNALYQPQ